MWVCLNWTPQKVLKVTHLLKKRWESLRLFYISRSLRPTSWDDGKATLMNAYWGLSLDTIDNVLRCARWRNGSDTRSTKYWVALREVWFDFLEYRVNDFDFESGLDTHVVVQIVLVDYWDVLMGIWCDRFPVWMQPRHEQRWMPGLRRQKASRRRCVGRN